MQVNYIVKKLITKINRYNDNYRKMIGSYNFMYMLKSKNARNKKSLHDL